MRKGDAVTSSKTIWDYQWQFAITINSGVVIVPNRNLVINLGFGKGASNTHNPEGVGHDLKLEEIQFPLVHPKFVMVDHLKDGQVFRAYSTTLSTRIKSHIKNLLPKTVLVNLVKPMKSFFFLSRSH